MTPEDLIYYEVLVLPPGSTLIVERGDPGPANLFVIEPSAGPVRAVRIDHSTKTWVFDPYTVQDSLMDDDDPIARVDRPRAEEVARLLEVSLPSETELRALMRQAASGPPLTSDEWAAFRDALRQALEARGDAVPPRDRDSLTVRQLDGCTFELGMDRLVHKVRGLPLATWAPTIEGYLADQQAHAEVMRRELLCQDLARVRTLLRPRLLRRDDLPAGESSLRRSLGADLVGVLEVEGPQLSHRVTMADAAAWGVAADELWGFAVENLGQEDHEVSQRGPVSWVSGASHYVASHALRLSELLVGPARHGVLFAVPHRDAVLFWPVLDGHSVVLLHGMAQVVDSLYGDDESLPLSPHLYWSVDGVFEQVGITQVDDNVTITGSERFAALVNRLLRESAERSG